MKPKARTLQERLGFGDPELATSAHDWLIQWLDLHALDLLAALYPQHVNLAWKDWYPDKLREQSRKNYAAAGYAAPELPKGEPPKPGIELGTKIWERPVMDRTFTIGFIDLWLSGSLNTELEISRGQWQLGGTNFAVAIEVKPVIRSVGELIRQLRLYQSYLPKGTVLVAASPDDRWSSTLEGQGIRYYRLPAPPGPSSEGG